MRQIKHLSKKVLAFAMSACLAVSSLAGINLTKTEEVRAAESGFTQYDFLKCNGANIKNNYGKGNNVFLRGTNVGNLYVQESWMSSTNATDQKTILNALTSRFGQDKALELLDYYESNYFTEADFDNCKNMGMSVLRVPFTYLNLYKQNGNSWTFRNDAFTRMDWIVEQASKRGMYVILDLHGAFGSQNGMDHSGEVIENASDVTFFSNETLMTQTLDLWKRVAQHYAGNPAVAGYDTLNEPGEKAGTTTTRHWNFYNRMYNTIRSVDPDHIIIFESCWGVNDLPNPANYGWTNIMYEYHHYPWGNEDNSSTSFNNQKNGIDNLVNGVNGKGYNIPTYIGEFNLFDCTDGWVYTLNKMNTEGWHYTNWSYKANGMGSWGIYHEKRGDKVQPWSTSENDIRTLWSADYIGTNNNDRGIAYTQMRPKLPGTVVFADKALDNSSYFAIKANINSKYVCADKNGEANLLADRDSGGEWEQFRAIKNSDGTYSFQARANNKYLCTVFDDADTEHPIIARSNQIGTWEKFYVEKQTDGTYALRTYENNYYVQADINDATAGILHATSATIGTWERFVLEPVSDPSVLPGNEGSGEQPTQAPTQAEVTTQQQVTNATNIPGTVQVTSYDAKTDGVSVTSSYAGNFNDGSFIRFNINATQSADYNLKLNLAAGDAQWNANSIRVAIDGNTVATTPVSATSGWEAFAENSVRINGISKGTHTITLTTVGGACNIGNFAMEIAGEETATLPAETTTTSANRVVGYFPSWSGNQINNVDWSALTHCMLAFFRYQNGTVINDFSQSDITNIVNKCKANGVKVSLALGGGGGFTYSEQPFNTQAKRTALINTLMNYVNQYGLDGIDIDIEVSDSQLWSDFGSFVSELSARLKAENKILTMAVSTWFTNPIATSTYQYFDFLNLMAYDAAFGDGPVAPWSTVTEQINYYKNRGMKDDQLVIGVPFYGYDASSNYISYRDLINRGAEYRNYDYYGGVYYNGESTIRDKAEYSKSYGGIMIWELSLDSFGQYSLLKVIKDTMATAVPVEPKISDIPGTVAVDSQVSKSSEITFTTANGVTYAGNLNNGSKLDYYIDVAQKGDYTFTFKFAAGNTQYNAKNMVIKINDSTVATIPVIGSTGWETFVDHTADINFPLKGQYKITIEADSGACNVANFSAVKKQSQTEAPTQAPTEKPTQAPTEAPTQAPTEAPTQAPTQKPTEAPTQKGFEPSGDDIILSTANSHSANDNKGLQDTFSWTNTGYQYQGWGTFSAANSEYKYLVIRYNGDISNIRLGNDSNPPTSVYWFVPGQEDGTNHSFVTTSGASLPSVSDGNTYYVIDLQKSGTSGDFFKSFHIHSGVGTNTVNINTAYLTKTAPAQEIVTEAPTEKPTEAPTEKPTEAPTEKPTEAPTQAPKYTVTVDGTVVATVDKGATYTFPTASKIGYYGDGKLYKPGSTYTVNKDVTFSSVKFAAAKTPGLRYTKPAGLSYQGKVSCSDAGVFDNAITETGVLAVTNDRLGNGAELVLDSKVGYIKFRVTSWLNNVAGSFLTSFEGIKENNYERDFVLRGYMLVNYADGSKATIYTAMTNPVSVSELAYKVFKNKTTFNSLSAEQKALVYEYLGVQ